VGSIAGAFVLPKVRTRLSTNRMVAAAMVLYAAALLVLVTTPVAWLGVLALLPAGMAWMGVLSTLNASLQTFLPGWVRARGLAIYQLVLFGSMAGAAAAWGAFADVVGLGTVHAVAAALLVAGAVAGLVVLPLRDTSGMDRSPAFWPDPQLELDASEHPGQVQVTYVYHVHGERRAALLALAPDLRRMRRRTGGTSWALYVDAADPGRYVEQYTVSSWTEHLLQHHGRLTGSDLDLDSRARSLSDPPVTIAHFFTARLPQD
jgi:MFS family permease